MSAKPSERAQELVKVIGPIDTAPGKKMVYKPRLMPRGMAESRGARRLGIQIVPGEVTRVETDNAMRVQLHGEGMADKDVVIAKLEAELAELKAKGKGKPGRKPKAAADADQA